MLSLTEVSASKFTGFVICFQPKAHKTFKGHVASLHIMKSHDFWALIDFGIIDIITITFPISINTLTSNTNSAPNSLSLPLQLPWLLPQPQTTSMKLYHQWYLRCQFHHHHHLQIHLHISSPSLSTWSTNHHHHVYLMTCSSTPPLHSCHHPAYHSHNQSLQTLVVSLLSNPHCLRQVAV